MSEDTPKPRFADIELALTARGLVGLDVDEWLARAITPNVIVGSPEIVAEVSADFVVRAGGRGGKTSRVSGERVELARAEALALADRLFPRRLPLGELGYPEGGEQYAAGFWLPYCASDEEARQHVKDFYATRTPALVLRAREGWAKGDAPSDSALFETLDDAGYSATSQARVRKMPRDLRRVARRRNTARRSVFEMASDEGGVTWAVCEYAIDPSGLRYVPCDVCRWRDPAHRAELTRRAREYAKCAQRLVRR